MMTRVLSLTNTNGRLVTVEKPKKMRKEYFEPILLWTKLAQWKAIFSEIVAKITFMKILPPAYFR